MRDIADMAAFTADDAVLSTAEIDLLVRSARRGDPRRSGHEAAERACGRLTLLLTVLGCSLWCANLLTVLKA